MDLLQVEPNGDRAPSWKISNEFVIPSTFISSFTGIWQKNNARGVIIKLDWSRSKIHLLWLLILDKFMRKLTKK